MCMPVDSVFFSFLFPVQLCWTNLQYPIFQQLSTPLGTTLGDRVASISVTFPSAININTMSSLVYRYLYFNGQKYDREQTWVQYLDIFSFFIYNRINPSFSTTKNTLYGASIPWNNLTINSCSHNNASFVTFALDYYLTSTNSLYHLGQIFLCCWLHFHRRVSMALLIINSSKLMQFVTLRN